jgi:hypothetical protein
VAVTVFPEAVTAFAATPPNVTLTQPSDVPEIVTIVPPKTEPKDGSIAVIVGGFAPLHDATAGPEMNTATVKAKNREMLFNSFIKLAPPSARLR